MAQGSGLFPALYDKVGTKKTPKKPKKPKH